MVLILFLVSPLLVAVDKTLHIFYAPFLCLPERKGAPKKGHPCHFVLRTPLRSSGLPKIRNLKTGFSIGKPSGAQKNGNGVLANRLS
jgi:hypothetical protein